MPDVQPLRALRYSVSAVGGLDRVVAPPYDVVDAEMRPKLAARSPHNVVHVDRPEGPDRYRHAAATLAGWMRQGAVERDPEPALWPLVQEFTGPDGRRRRRHGFLARVRLEEYRAGSIRPHERTHAAAKEDRLRLTRATQANLSPVFGLYHGGGAGAWEALEPETQSAPWAEATDDHGTTHRLWRVADPGRHAEVASALRGAEILIADGHHRYETSLCYAREIGGAGDHQYVLMCLVAAGDPGLAVFPIHRLIGRLDPARRERLETVIATNFDAEPVSIEAACVPGPDGTPGVFGYVDSTRDGGLRLTLARAEAVDRLLAGRSDAYRRLDTAMLEALVLREALGMTEEDIADQRGLRYIQNTAETVELVRSGQWQAAFLLRPTPMERVLAVAAAGETMPPKSTYFYPKLPSGLLFNPLA